MKDSLFELLMNFFEKSLSQLKERSEANANKEEDEELLDASSFSKRTLVLKSAQETAIRVFTDDEKLKFTRASYQFLSRLLLWGIMTPDTLESIITQLLFSESRFVSLEETKWTIRNTLAENLSAAQLTFLDLVLYQKEDNFLTH